METITCYHGNTEQTVQIRKIWKRTLPYCMKPDIDFHWHCLARFGLQWNRDNSFSLLFSFSTISYLALFLLRIDRSMVRTVRVSAPYTKSQIPHAVRKQQLLIATNSITSSITLKRERETLFTNYQKCILVPLIIAYYILHKPNKVGTLFNRTIRWREWNSIFTNKKHNRKWIFKSSTSTEPVQFEPIAYRKYLKVGLTRDFEMCENFRRFFINPVWNERPPIILQCPYILFWMESMLQQNQDHEFFFHSSGIDIVWQQKSFLKYTLYVRMYIHK